MHGAFDNVAVPAVLAGKHFVGDAHRTQLAKLAHGGGLKCTRHMAAALSTAPAQHACPRLRMCLLPLLR